MLLQMSSNPQHVLSPSFAFCLLGKDKGGVSGGRELLLLPNEQAEGQRESVPQCSRGGNTWSTKRWTGLKTP